MSERRPRGLMSRLFRSHLGVMALAVIAMFVLAAILAPVFFGPEFDNFGPDGSHRRPPKELRSTFNRAMFGALVVGVVGAVGAAAVMTRSIARRLTNAIAGLASATRRLADGDYSARAAGSDTTELAELAGDVNTLASRLEETEQFRLRLIGDVAHELRTPLTMIEGSMEAILDGVIEPSDEVFSSIAREAGRLERLANDLSNLSNAGEQSSELTIAPTDLGAVVRHVTDRLRPQFDAKGVSLTVAARTGDHAAVDADRFAQVITNVVGNALAYTPSGGSVDVTVASTDRGATITVADTGVGIARTDLDRIFERFFRIEDGPGTGVGLTIARTLMRRMGGDVTADSPGPGGGATFTITASQR